MIKAGYISLLLILSSCITPFEIEPINSESVIVIEANLTDEVKAHRVGLFRTASLDSVDQAPIKGATVWIEDQDGQQVFFNSQSDGEYFTDANYTPELGKSYTLHVELPNGDSYASDPAKMLPKAVIDRIYGEFKTVASSADETDRNGVAGLLDGHDLGGNTAWFRYEWEQTYEIITPYLSEFLWDNELRDIVPRENEIHRCYRTESNTNLILDTTQGLTEEVIRELPVQFLDDDSLELRTRYSIKVRQHSISSTAYQYYKRLKDNNEGGGTFFDRQKGTVLGNIHSVSNANEVVLGYFEMASVNEKRIFLSPEDFREDGFGFAGYVLCDSERDVKFLSDREIEFTRWRAKYLIIGRGGDLGLGGWNLALPPCVDCRELGPYEKPEFWKEL